MIDGYMVSACIELMSSQEQTHTPATLADEKTHKTLTLHTTILRIILWSFYLLIINILKTLRIIMIMLNRLIYKGFFIFQYNNYTDSAAFAMWLILTYV